VSLSTIAQRAAAYLQSLATAGGQGTAGLIADRSSYLASVSTGTLIATLIDPYGGGSAFTVVGNAPATLALAAGGRIMTGAGLSVPGTESTIVIRATKGQRAIEEPLTFVAKAEPVVAPTPAPTPTPTPAPTAVSIEGTPPKTGKVGVAYAFVPVVSNGAGQKTFTLANGVLLGGLVFDPSTGAITGTPTVAGTMAGLVIRVSDATGSANTQATNVTIAEASAAPPPSIALASYAAPNPVNYGAQTGVAYVDTTSTVHSVGYRYAPGKNTADFLFNMTDATTGNAFRLNNDGRWSFGIWNGTFQVDNRHNFIAFSSALTSGVMLEARVNTDGTAGLYQGDQLVSRLIPADNLRTPRGNGVALKVTVGPAVPDVTYGAINPQIFVRDPDFDPFERRLNIDLNYADHAGAVPDYPEVSFNGGEWLRARNATNPVPGRATVALDNVPTTFNGLVAGRIRWHNNPDAVAAFEFDAVLPFGGLFGLNGGAGEFAFYNDHTGYAWSASDKDRARLGNIATLGQFDTIAASTDGAGGTVQRDINGGIGVNSLGITHYRLFREFIVNAENAGEYQMDFLPGVEVTFDTFAYLPGWSYDQATGRGTFTATAGKNQVFGIYVRVATIPAGQMLYARLRKVNAVGTYNAAQVDLFKGIADMSRDMDGTGINNTNNTSRTITALPVRTVANSGTGAITSSLTTAKLIDAKALIAINSHIDGPEYVKAHADYIAANTPAGMQVFVSNFNELWNFIFSHFYDMHLGGVRAGYGPLDATVANAVPMTVLDAGQMRATGSTLFVGCDASGVERGTAELNTHIKTTRALSAGDLFIKNVGGLPLFRAKGAIPAGTVTSNTALLQSTDPNYEVAQNDAWCNRAALRYASSLAKRNILIWKASFAAAGKPAPKFMIEGRVGIASYAFPMLEWDGLAEHIDYNTSAPYISGGFSFDYMDWTRTDIWDDAARALIASEDYAGAIELIIPRALAALPEMGKAMRGQQAAQRAFNVARFGAAGRDRIGQYFYEYGDHFGFSKSNWPDNGKAMAFWNNFRSHPLYYTLFTAYLEEMARIGAPANWYRGGVGGSSFHLFKNEADTVTSGAPGTNWRYKAVRDIVARTRAAVAKYG
jgi:hypothetical protein